MGHSTWIFLTRYIGYKYGSKALDEKKLPIQVLPLKQLARYKEQILSAELVYAFLLRKSKQHRTLMQAYIFSDDAHPIPYLNTLESLSRFARVSKGSLDPNPKIRSLESSILYKRFKLIDNGETAFDLLRSFTVKPKKKD
jgi:hypothetical protein